MAKKKLNLRQEYEELQAMEYHLAGRSLAFFTRAAWEVLEPETPMLWNYHHDLICEYLQAVNLGQIRRLIINIAPRTSKSTMATVCFPTWTWARRPHYRFMFGSYSESLAVKHSMFRRNLIESAWYQGGWGGMFRLASDSNTKAEFTNDKTGHMKSLGIGGSATGFGADTLVIDDPHNPTGAESEAERESTVENFDLAWTTRLNNKKTGSIIVVMQRLHEKDLTGHLLAKNAGYTHLKIPSIAETHQKIYFPITKKIITREAGDILHPARDGAVELAAAKIDLGEYGFAGQHQQEPVPHGGAMIKRHWFKVYRERPARFDQIIQSWDFAVKAKTTSDYTVGLVIGRIGAEKYVLDMVREQANFTGQLSMLVALSRKWPMAHKKVIESKANGPAIVAMLHKTVSGLVEIEPDGDKISRMTSISPDIEAGNVWVPDPSIGPWVSDFLAEVCNFPRATHDDTVDALTQGIRELRRASVATMPLAGHSGIIHGR